MSRLLHAAARGARLQCSLVGIWEDTKVRPSAESNMTRWRIHPKDVHLQYGPISSALREFAEKGRDPHTLYGVLATRAFAHECWYPPVMEDEGHHAELFALILAEALADEGL